MLKHAEIWRALDKLAAENGLSASGLARKAGLDPTAFNKSKRINPQGKPRWPTMESVAKVLAATDSTLAEMARILGPSGGRSGRRYPVIGMAKAGQGGFFDDAGYPTGSGWDEIDGPDVGDPNAYALEITGDSMAPVYRPRDLIIVSPAATIKAGDRVVVRTRDGQVMAKELIRRTTRRVELKSVNSRHVDPVVTSKELDWMARIMWSSQ
jgi:phage repressor protein C with HTH and peptisase S24 domain